MNSLRLCLILILLFSLSACSGQGGGGGDEGTPNPAGGEVTDNDGDGDAGDGDAGDADGGDGDTGGDVVADLCGDGRCGASETNASCPAECLPDCGNEVCAGDETVQSCPADCPASCGDSYCTHAETVLTCPGDCPAVCGDGSCTRGENSTTCADDCPVGCGDGACNGSETAGICPDDCPANCGDGACTHSENALTCGGDCRAECGDGLCTHTENVSTCDADCDVRCGDGVCSAPTENTASCLADCPATPVACGSAKDVGVGRMAPIVANHAAVAEFSDIPADCVSTAKTRLKIFYGHTSHGSQLITGMEMLGSPYYSVGSHLNIIEDTGVDLGHRCDQGWVDRTTADDVLGRPANGFNVVIYSWCGGVSDNTAACIGVAGDGEENSYLESMARLEAAYPNVTFIYMTGRHWNQDGWARASNETDGNRTAINGQISTRNQMIRDYAIANNKILFDFADIEEYTPDATGHHSDTSDDLTDSADWGGAWCTANGNPNYCSECGECAHSRCLNCYMKGRAFWWLMARIAGWNGE